MPGITGTYTLEPPRGHLVEVSVGFRPGQTVTPLCTHIARLISIINKHGVSLVNGNISDIRSLTHMISDQSHLAYNMSKRDNQVVPECRHCPGTKETAEHFIGKCPYFSILRQQTFGTHPITIAQIIKFHGCPKLIKFITKSGRLEEEFVRFYIDWLCQVASL